MRTNLIAITIFVFLFSIASCGPSGFLVAPQITKIAESNTVSIDPPSVSELTIAPFESAVSNDLEKTLDEIMAKSGARSVSVCAAIPGEGFWANSRYIGSTNDPNIVLPDTLFHSASVGKMFTAVTIFRLLEQGNLSLDDPVANWFPDFPNGRAICIRHLLNHTSSIASFELLGEYRRSEICRPEVLIGMAAKYPPLFTTDEAISYCNTGYVMLGRIAEKVSGKSYSELINEFIATPLGLKRFVVLTPENTETTLNIVGHHLGAPFTGYERYSNPYSAGCIAINPSELVVFLSGLFSGKLISKPHLDAMFTDMRRMSLTEPPVYYGKGIVAIVGTPIGDIYGHSGGFPGFYTALYYNPKLNLYVCAMMNDDPKPVEPAMFLIMKYFFDRKQAAQQSPTR